MDVGLKGAPDASQGELKVKSNQTTKSAICPLCKGFFDVTMQKMPGFRAL
jgi:hypothetical protein